MQWDASAQAGFTSGTAWLQHTNQDEVNVESAERGGILPFYRRLIELRHTEAVISEGTYLPYESPEEVFAYVREHEGVRLLALHNFRAYDVDVDLPDDFARGRVLIGNYDDATVSSRVTLRPYETLSIITNA